MNTTGKLSRQTALIVCWALLVVGCSKEPAEKEAEVSVQASVVERAPMRQIISAEAILFPLHQAAITPKINAPVQKFYVNRGSRVHRGQLLAVLENRDLAAAQVENKGAYQQAQAEYQRTTTASVPEEMQKARLEAQAAKQELDAQQKIYDARENLFKQGALPRKELDAAGVALTQARNQYQIAQRHLNALQSGGREQALEAAQGQLTSAKGKYLAAEAQLGYTEIRSPIDGVVTERPVWPGEMPAAGTPILTIMDLSQVTARAHIPQEQAAQLKVGDAATITAPGIEGEVAGKVTVVSPALDANSTTVEVWVQAKNPQTELKPGSTVRVAMVARTVPDAIVIPASALLTGEGGATSVMRIGEDGKAHTQEVEVGIRQPDAVQILKGLRPGERVVTAGAYGLPDNTKVRAAAPGQKSEEKAGDGSRRP